MMHQGRNSQGRQRQPRSRDRLSSPSQRGATRVGSLRLGHCPALSRFECRVWNTAARMHPWASNWTVATVSNEMTSMDGSHTRETYRNRSSTEQVGRQAISRLGWYQRTIATGRNTYFFAVCCRRRIASFCILSPSCMYSARYGKSGGVGVMPT